MNAAGKRYIAYPSRSSEINIWNFADLHLLTKGCARNKLQKDIDTVANDPNSFWVGGGDYCECISPTDKRFDSSVLPDDMTIADLGDIGSFARKSVRDLFFPIRHKCLGLLYGNHEKSYMKKQNQLMWHHWLCSELNVPDLGYCCLMDIAFRRIPCKAPMLAINKKIQYGATTNIRFFLHHGASGATTPGGKLNKLIHFMNCFMADIYMVGHVHDQIAKRLVHIGGNANCDTVVQVEKLGIITGTYLRTYTQDVTIYGEEKGYAPTPLGARFVTIKPNTREFRAEV